jgi:hypothetical protein
MVKPAKGGTMKRWHMPSPALVIALVALFVSLGGTAVAAGVVPLAKRALMADNAMKVGGQTSASITAAAARQPGPASSAAGLVTVKTAPWSLAPGGYADTAVMCNSGQKAVGGGYDDPSGDAHAWDTRPTGDGGGWRVIVALSNDAKGQQSGLVYAICLR